MKITRFKATTSQPLLQFLISQMPDVSRTQVKQHLANDVYVDGRPVSQFNFLLQPGMEVTIEKRPFKQRFRPRGLDIVYEDHHLLVINKHEGILSYSKNPKDQTVITILNAYLAATHQRSTAHIVHRLDRDTSGLMIVAKTKQVSQLFEADWKGLVTQRTYVAVAWGNVQPDSGTIHTWLTDGPYSVLSSPTNNGGKEAITHYRVIRRSRRYSLLELNLDTGRRNQIRVHLRELQHPIVHDPLYGYKDDISPINRLALHAFRLHFTHPITKQQKKFETPYPESFKKLMEIFR